MQGAIYEDLNVSKGKIWMRIRKYRHIFSFTICKSSCIDCKSPEEYVQDFIPERCTL